MKKEEIFSKKSNQTIGPYSQAIKFGNLIFVSGQIGINPKTNELVSGDISSQTKQTFTNLKNVLDDGGSSLDNVVKVNVYLIDMNIFPVINEIYAQFFNKPYPARATMQVCKLPKGAMIEIDCIAFINCPPSHKASEGERGCCYDC